MRQHSYPEWQQAYESALFEFDTNALEEKVRRAKQAIAERLEALRDASDSEAEQKSIDYALRNLDLLLKLSKDQAA